MYTLWNPDRDWLRRLRNGGILRSLTPSNGWNRLIAAIENWSHLDIIQQHQSTSMETLTNTSTSVADGQVQVDFKSDASNESSDSTPRFTKKRDKSQDVFIPLSNSFKCLSWRQQEIQQIPTTTGSSTTSEDEAFVSVPTTPTVQPKINHLKYMVPVYFPVTRNVDSEGRISEKIHGTIEKLHEPTRVVPTEVSNRFQSSPLIRDKYPTLVNPQPIPNSPKMESCSPLDGAIWDENLNYVKSVQVKGQESLFSFNIPNVSEFSSVAHHPVRVYQSTDEDEEPASCAPTPPKFRRARLHFSCDPVTFDLDQEQNDTGIGNSYTNSTISSSSYESLQVLSSPKKVLPVKTVSRADFNFGEIEEKLDSLQCDCAHQLASVSCLESSEEVGDVRRFSRNSSSSPELMKPVSRFHKFFGQELTELETIGKQLKSLKQKTEKYNKLKPYLVKIEQLTTIDHSCADPELDAEIEQCSGWNVGIEFQKVQTELTAINKILQRGSSSPKLQSESSLSNPESSGSVSLDSHRSSNGSFSNNDDVFPLPRNQNPSKSASVPLMTSTPKGHDLTSKGHGLTSPPAHVPSTFWSDFYKRMGPNGEGDRKMFNVALETDLEFQEELRQHQRRRWRPFLPKTHNYLCHQNGYTGGYAGGYPGAANSNHPSSCNHLRPPRPQSAYTAQYQVRRQHFPTHVHSQYRKQHVRSLSSEGSSSVHDGSQSDQYCSHPQGHLHGSNDFCSCHDSLDSYGGGVYWDSSFDNDYSPYCAYQNGTNRVTHDHNGHSTTHAHVHDAYRTTPKVNNHRNIGYTNYSQFGKY